MRTSKALLFVEVVQLVRTELLYAERSRVRVTPSTLMNDEKIITFAYIAGREHAAVSITEHQYNQIKSILYGDEKV